MVLVKACWWIWGPNSMYVWIRDIRTNIYSLPLDCFGQFDLYWHKKVSSFCISKSVYYFQALVYGVARWRRRRAPPWRDPPTTSPPCPSTPSTTSNVREVHNPPRPPSNQNPKAVHPPLLTEIILAVIMLARLIAEAREMAARPLLRTKNRPLRRMILPALWNQKQTPF